MVYCNHSSLVIFVNDAKYIHFYPTFQLPPALSHCRYKPFIKSIKFCLFRYKYWLKMCIWVSIHSLKCFKTVWSRLFISTHCSHLVTSYRLDRNGRLLKLLRILITVVYFKDRNWLPKTVSCISCLVVCKIVFCSKFPDIPDNAGKGTRRERRRRRRTLAIAKCYAFHANAIN